MNKNTSRDDIQNVFFLWYYCKKFLLLRILPRFDVNAQKCLTNHACRQLSYFATYLLDIYINSPTYHYNSEEWGILLLFYLYIPHAYGTSTHRRFQVPYKYAYTHRLYSNIREMYSKLYISRLRWKNMTILFTRPADKRSLPKKI